MSDSVIAPDELYSYVSSPNRSTMDWPQGASLAIAFVVFVEHYEAHPPPSAVSDRRLGAGFSSQVPDYWTAAVREYGNRVGIFRILDVLDRFAATATLAVGSAACALYPNLVEEAIARRWALVAHGSYATRMISSAMPEDDERAEIARAAAAVAAATGHPPEGWIGQDWGESRRTPQLLADAGFGYVADWPNDDQPYVMSTKPSIVSLPRQADLDDAEAIWVRSTHPRDWVASVLAAIEVMSAERGRSLTLGIHPWVLGQPHQIRYFEALVAAVSRRDDVWIATTDEVAARFGPAS